MTAIVLITRAGPLASIQDAGRLGMLGHGISQSGAMDGGGFARAGLRVGAGRGGIEITMAGIELRVESGACSVGFDGGDFEARHNGQREAWPGRIELVPGDVLAVTPGAWGNYGYLRFNGVVDVPPVLGSVSTNSRARLGGLDGRALRAGDRLRVDVGGDATGASVPTIMQEDGPIRVIWGLHADLLPDDLRRRFIGAGFVVSSRLDRMGVRLEDRAGVFADAAILSLVSDAVVPGDIQILGDGTPIVLMRDHQPTGGYPRIATVITADLDRFAQMRPGSAVAFEPVTVEHAHTLLRSRQT